MLLWMIINMLCNFRFIVTNNLIKWLITINSRKSNDIVDNKIKIDM